MSNKSWQWRRVSDLIDGLVAGVSVRSMGGPSDGPAILKTSAVDKGRFIPSESKRILDMDLPRARCNPAQDSMIVSRMNTPALVGDVGYVAEHRPDLFLPDRLWTARAKRGSETSMRWLTYYFASEPGAKVLQSLATGTSGSMKNIPKDRILNLEIPVPMASEQRAIAAALAHIDALIETLERLVAKKCDVKQGMMQELLTGRTRLPGFTADWDPVRLRDAGTTYGGLIGKDKADFGAGSALFVTFMEVMSGPRLRGTRLERVRVQKGESQNRVERGDILFNGSSETPEEVALAAAVDFETSGGVFLNSFCFGLRLNHRQRIDPMYLAYYFRSSAGRAAVSALAQGATRYNIAKSKLVDLAPELPPLPEQQAIAKVLRDADTEIEALERRLESTRAVKVGMMQELLTGRTRPPLTEES